MAKRMRRRENPLCLVFKIAQRLEHSWRPPNGGLTIMTMVLGGARIVVGVYVPPVEEGKGSKTPQTRTRARAGRRESTAGSRSVSGEWGGSS